MNQRTRFVLLCHQRSGSNALTSLISQHPQIALAGQLFNNGLDHFYYNLRDYRLPLYKAPPNTKLHFGNHLSLRRRLGFATLRFIPRINDLAVYLNRYWAWYDHRQDKRSLGFKLHDYQLVEQEMRELFDEQVDRIVILSRRNLLKAAVSWGVALQTNRWISKPHHESLPPVTLDIDEITWFIAKTRRNVARWKELAAESPTPHLCIEYETHVTTRNLKPLLQFLNVDSDFDARFQLKKLSSRNYSHVANAREINDALGNDANGFLFEE